MKEPLYAVYGASGCGRSIMPVARRQLELQRISPGRLVFVDDAISDNSVNSHSVMTYERFLSVPASDRYVAIAIANSRVRERVAATCASDGVAPWSIQAENAVVMDNTTIDAGGLLSPFATITSNVSIGCYFHCNLYSYVEHDCRVGNFVTFAPGVKCNGNVIVGDHAYVGAGAILRNGTPDDPLQIGSAAVVGCGAVVIDDVPAGVTVVGNPARPIAGGPQRA